MASFCLPPEIKAQIIYTIYTIRQNNNAKTCPASCFQRKWNGKQRHSIRKERKDDVNPLNQGLGLMGSIGLFLFLF